MSCHLLVRPFARPVQSASTNVVSTPVSSWLRFSWHRTHVIPGLITADIASTICFLDQGASLELSHLVETLAELASTLMLFDAVFYAVSHDCWEKRLSFHVDDKNDKHTRFVRS